MKKVTFLFFFFALKTLVFAQETYIYCGKLLDMTSNEVKNEMTIIVEKNKIKSVQKNYIVAPASAQSIDLKSKTVLPGLIDMHVHVETTTERNGYINKYTLSEAAVAYRAIKYVDATLMAGFTTVRDMGGSGVNISLRDAINKGLVKGPRIFTAGKAVSVTGGHGDPTNGAKEGLWEDPNPNDGVADGPDECRKAVRNQYKRGADWIKVTGTGGVLSVAKDGKLPHYSQEELDMIVKTANDLGLKVACHAHGDEGIYRAVMAGVTTVEHGTFMSDRTMDAMIKKGTYYVPTVIAGKSTADSAKIEGYYNEFVRAKALEIGPKIQETFGRAYKRGVKIAFGTDAGVYPHGKNANEFIYMTEVGMPAYEALKSATVVNAEVLEMADKLGKIEVGKLADIIAVDENPLDNVKTLQNVRFVMKDGKVFKN